jgi:mono/diheme cytochrome c family protein
MHHERRRMSRFLAGAIAATLAAGVWAGPEETLKRGAYLVTVGGCTDCHTPGHFLGAPDMKRFLGGSDVGFAVPGRGVFAGPNLTPDKETGLGSWTTQQIVTAFTTGKRPDGRMLVPVMPYPAFAQLSPDDAQAIAAYLQSLPPVRNKVGGPFGPTDEVTSFVMNVLPADAYNAMPKPPPGK